MVTASQKAQDEAEAALDAALDALANQHAPGPLSQRFESATDEVQKTAVRAFAEVLGGGMAESKALREVVRRGLLALRDERASRV